MTVEEFNIKRKPFFIDSETLIVKFPSSKHRDSSHAEWFTDLGYPWCHAIRGYVWESEKHEDDFMMVYWNNFEIPNITCMVINYLFEYFPNIKWVGLGCKKGIPGEIWEPQIKITKNS